LKLPNIFKLLCKRKQKKCTKTIEKLTKELIIALEEKGIEIDNTCDLIDIWIHNKEEIEITHSTLSTSTQDCGKFKF
jgi:hypothetical protein